jgi:hypothetical protein
MADYFAVGVIGYGCAVTRSRVMQLGDGKNAHRSSVLAFSCGSHYEYGPSPERDFAILAGPLPATAPSALGANALPIQ